MFTQADLAVNDTLHRAQAVTAFDEQDVRSTASVSEENTWSTVKPSEPEVEVPGVDRARDTVASIQEKATADQVLTHSIAPPESAATSSTPSWSQQKEAKLAQRLVKRTSLQLQALRQKLLLPIPTTVAAQRSPTAADVKLGQGLMEKGFPYKAYNSDDTDSRARFAWEESQKRQADETNLEKLSTAVAAYNAMIEQSNLEFLRNPPVEVLALREALSAMIAKTKRDFQTYQTFN